MLLLKLEWFFLDCYAELLLSPMSGAFRINVSVLVSEVVEDQQNVDL